MKNRYIALLSFTLAAVISGAAAFAAATGDRLKVPVMIGQGLTVVEKLIFDLNLGSANPVIQSTSGGTIQLSNNGTNMMTVPTATDQFVGRATPDTLTNKDLSALSNSYRAANGSTDGVVTGVAQTFAGQKTFGSSINAAGGFDFQSGAYATASVPGLMSTIAQTFSGAKTFTNATINGGGVLSGTFTGSPTFSGSPSFSTPVFTGQPSFNAGASFGSSTIQGNVTFQNSPTITGHLTINGTGGNVVHGCTRRTSTNAGSSAIQACSGAEIVTGGGCSANAAIWQTNPGTDTQWNCSTNGVATSVSVWAICCNL